MKRLLCMVLTIVMALSLTAAFAEDDPLRVAWWGSQTSSSIYLAVDELFIKETGIQTLPEYCPFADYETKLNTMAAGNILPDEFRTDYCFIKNFVDKGLLMDLTPLVESGLIDLSNVDPAAIQGGMINGGLYGINAGSNAYCAIFNKKLVEEAGMEIPSNECTWEEFEQWAIEFTEKTGKYAVDLYGVRDYELFRIFARSVNEALYSEDQLSVGYTAETLAAFYASIQRMLNAGATQKIADITVDVGDESRPFAKGEAAVYFTYNESATTYAMQLKEIYGEDVLVYNIVPGSAANKGMFVQPSQYLSISANTQRVEDAAAYINYWVNSPEANLSVNGRRGVPINPEMSKLVGENLDDIARHSFEYIDLVAKYSSDLYAPDPAAHDEISDAWKDAFVGVMYGDMTAEEAAQSVIDLANNALNN